MDPSNKRGSNPERPKSTEKPAVLSKNEQSKNEYDKIAGGQSDSTSLDGSDFAEELENGLSDQVDEREVLIHEPGHDTNPQRTHDPKNVKIDDVQYNSRRFASTKQNNTPTAEMGPTDLQPEKSTQSIKFTSSVRRQDPQQHSSTHDPTFPQENNTLTNAPRQHSFLSNISQMESFIQPNNKFRNINKYGTNINVEGRDIYPKPTYEHQKNLSQHDLQLGRKSAHKEISNTNSNQINMKQRNSMSGRVSTDHHKEAMAQNFFQGNASLKTSFPTTQTHNKPINGPGVSYTNSSQKDTGTNTNSSRDNSPNKYTFREGVVEFNSKQQFKAPNHNQGDTILQYPTRNFSHENYNHDIPETKQFKEQNSDKKNFPLNAALKESTQACFTKSGQPTVFNQIGPKKLEDFSGGDDSARSSSNINGFKNKETTLKKETIQKIIKLRAWLRSESSLECIYRSIQFTNYFSGFAEGILKELPYGSTIVDPAESVHKNEMYGPLQDRSLIYRLLHRLKYSSPPPPSLIAVLYHDLLYDPLFYNKCLIIKTIVIYIRKWKDSIDKRVYEGLNSIINQIQTDNYCKSENNEDLKNESFGESQHVSKTERGGTERGFRTERGSYEQGSKTEDMKGHPLFVDSKDVEGDKSVYSMKDSPYMPIVKKCQNNRIICSLLNEIMTFFGFAIKIHDESFHTINSFIGLLIAKRTMFNNREWYSIMAKCVKLICENRALKQYILDMPFKSEYIQIAETHGKKDKLSALFQLVISQLNISPFQHELDKEILQTILVLAKQDQDITFPYVDQIFAIFLQPEGLQKEPSDLPEMFHEDVSVLPPYLLYILSDLAILYSNTAAISQIYQKTIQMLIKNNIDDMRDVYRGFKTHCNQDTQNTRIYSWSLPNIRYLLDILLKLSDMRNDCRNNYFVSMYFINKTLWCQKDITMGTDKDIKHAKTQIFDPEYMTIENRAKTLCHILRRCFDLLKFSISKDKGVLRPYEKECVDRIISDLLLYHSHGNKNIYTSILDECCNVRNNSIDKKEQYSVGQGGFYNNFNEFIDQIENFNEKYRPVDKKEQLFDQQVHLGTKHGSFDQGDPANIKKGKCIFFQNNRFGSLIDNLLKEMFSLISYLPNPLYFYQKHRKLLLFQNQNITFMMPLNNILLCHEVLTYLLDQTVKTITEFGRTKYLKKCHCCMNNGTPYDSFYMGLLKSAQALFISLQQSKQQNMSLSSSAQQSSSLGTSSGANTSSSASPQTNIQISTGLINSLNKKFIEFCHIFLSKKFYHLITCTFQTLTLDIPPSFLEKLLKTDLFIVNSDLFYLEAVLSLPVTMNPLLTWIREYFHCMEKILSVKYIAAPESNSKENQSSHTTSNLNIESNKTIPSNKERLDYEIHETDYFTLSRLISLKSMALSHTESFLENLRTDFLLEMLGNLNIIRVIKEVLQFVIEAEFCVTNSFICQNVNNQEEITTKLNDLRLQTVKILSLLKDDQKKAVEQQQWPHSQAAINEKEERIEFIPNYSHMKTGLIDKQGPPQYFDSQREHPKHFDPQHAHNVKHSRAQAPETTTYTNMHDFTEDHLRHSLVLLTGRCYTSSNYHISQPCDFTRVIVNCDRPRAFFNILHFLNNKKCEMEQLEYDCIMAMILYVCSISSECVDECIDSFAMEYEQNTTDTSIKGDNLTSKESISKEHQKLKEQSMSNDFHELKKNSLSETQMEIRDPSIFIRHLLEFLIKSPSHIALFVLKDTSNHILSLKILHFFIDKIQFNTNKFIVFVPEQPKHEKHGNPHLTGLNRTNNPKHSKKEISINEYSNSPFLSNILTTYLKYTGSCLKYVRDCGTRGLFFYMKNLLKHTGKNTQPQHADSGDENIFLLKRKNENISIICNFIDKNILYIIRAFFVLVDDHFLDVSESVTHLLYKILAICHKNSKHKPHHHKGELPHSNEKEDESPHDLKNREEIALGDNSGYETDMKTYIARDKLFNNLIQTLIKYLSHSNLLLCKMAQNLIDNVADIYECKPSDILKRWKVEILSPFYRKRLVFNPQGVNIPSNPIKDKQSKKGPASHTMKLSTFDMSSLPSYQCCISYLLEFRPFMLSFDSRLIRFINFTLHKKHDEKEMTRDFLSKVVFLILEENETHETSSAKSGDMDEERKNTILSQNEKLHFALRILIFIILYNTSTLNWTIITKTTSNNLLKQAIIFCLDTKLFKIKQMALLIKALDDSHVLDTILAHPISNTSMKNQSILHNRATNQLSPQQMDSSHTNLFTRFVSFLSNQSISTSLEKEFFLTSISILIKSISQKNYSGPYNINMDSRSHDLNTGDNVSNSHNNSDTLIMKTNISMLENMLLRFCELLWSTIHKDNLFQRNGKSVSENSSVCIPDIAMFVVKTVFFTPTPDILIGILNSNHTTSLPGKVLHILTERAHLSYPIIFYILQELASADQNAAQKLEEWLERSLPADCRWLFFTENNLSIYNRLVHVESSSLKKTNLILHDLDTTNPFDVIRLKWQNPSREREINESSSREKEINENENINTIVNESGVNTAMATVNKINIVHLPQNIFDPSEFNYIMECYLNEIYDADLFRICKSIYEQNVLDSRVSGISETSSFSESTNFDETGNLDNLRIIIQPENGKLPHLKNIDRNGKYDTLGYFKKYDDQKGAFSCLQLDDIILLSVAYYGLFNPMFELLPFLLSYTPVEYNRFLFKVLFRIIRSNKSLKGQENETMVSNFLLGILQQETLYRQQIYLLYPLILSLSNTTQKHNSCFSEPNENTRQLSFFQRNSGILLELSDSVVRLLNTVSIVHHRVALGLFKVVYDSLDLTKEAHSQSSPDQDSSDQRRSNKNRDTSNDNGGTAKQNIAEVKGRSPFSPQVARSIFTLLFSLTIHHSTANNFLLYGLFYFKNCTVKQSFLNLNEPSWPTAIIAIGLEMYKEKIKILHRKKEQQKSIDSSVEQSNVKETSTILPKLLAFLQQSAQHVFIDQHAEFNLMDYMPKRNVKNTESSDQTKYNRKDLMGDTNQMEVTNQTEDTNEKYTNRMEDTNQNNESIVDHKNVAYRYIQEDPVNPMAIIISFLSTDFLLSLLETLSIEFKQTRVVSLLITELSLRLSVKKYLNGLSFTSFSTERPRSEIFDQYSRITTALLPYVAKPMAELILNVLSDQNVESFQNPLTGSIKEDFYDLKKNTILLNQLLIAQSLPKNKDIPILSGLRSSHPNIRAISYQVLYKLIENEMDIDFNMNHVIYQSVYGANKQSGDESRSFLGDSNYVFHRNAHSVKIPHLVSNLINMLTPLEHIRLLCLNYSFSWYNFDITAQILQNCSESLFILYITYQMLIFQSDRLGCGNMPLSTSNTLRNENIYADNVFSIHKNSLPNEGFPTLSNHKNYLSNGKCFDVSTQIPIQDYLELTTTQPFISFLPFIPCDVDFDSYLSFLRDRVQNRTIRKALFHIQIDEYDKAQSILNQVIKQIAHTEKDTSQKGNTPNSHKPGSTSKKPQIINNGSFSDHDIHILEHFWIFCAKQLYQYDSIGEIGIRINDLEKIIYGQFHGQVSSEERNTLKSLIQAKYHDSDNDFTLNVESLTDTNKFSSKKAFDVNNIVFNNLNTSPSIIKMPFYSLIKQFVNFNMPLFNKSIVYLSAYLLSCDRAEAITMTQSMFENFQAQPENISFHNQLDYPNKMVSIYPHWSDNLLGHYILFSLRKHLLTDSSSLKSLHNIAKGYNHLGLLNFYNNFLDVAQYHLSKIFSLSNIEIVDAYHKIHTDLLVYEKRKQNSLGIDFVNIANLNFFSNTHKSRLLSLKGQLAQNEVFLKQSCQLADVPENWYAWGDFLKEKMFKCNSESDSKTDLQNKDGINKIDSTLGTPEGIGPKSENLKQMDTSQYQSDNQGQLPTNTSPYPKSDIREGDFTKGQRVTKGWPSNNLDLNSEYSHLRNNPPLFAGFAQKQAHSEISIEKECFTAFLYTLNNKSTCENENIRKHAALVLLRLFYNRNFSVLQNLINNIDISYFHFYIPLLLEQLQTKEYFCAELILHKFVETHAQTIYIECLGFETNVKKRFSLIDHDFTPEYPDSHLQYTDFPQKNRFINQFNKNTDLSSNIDQNTDPKTSSIKNPNAHFRRDSNTTTDMSLGMAPQVSPKVRTGVGSNARNIGALENNTLHPDMDDSLDLNEGCFDSKNKKFDRSPMKNLQMVIIHLHYQMVHSMEQLRIILNRTGQLDRYSLYICIIDKAFRLAMEIYFCLFRKNEYTCKRSEIDRRLSYFDKDRDNNPFEYESLDDIPDLNLFGAFDEASSLLMGKNVKVAPEKKKAKKRSKPAQKKDLNLLFATLKFQIERISMIIYEPGFRDDFYDKELTISEIIKLLYKWKHLMISRRKEEKSIQMKQQDTRDEAAMQRPNSYTEHSEFEHTQMKKETKSEQTPSDQDIASSNKAEKSQHKKPNQNITTKNRKDQSTSVKNTNLDHHKSVTETFSVQDAYSEKNESKIADHKAPFYFNQGSKQKVDDELYSNQKVTETDKEHPRNVRPFENITLDELLFLNLHLSQFNIPCIEGLRPQKCTPIGIAGFNRGKQNEIQLIGVNGKFYNFTFVYNIHSQTSDYNLMMNNLMGYFIDNEKEALHLQRRTAKLHPFKHLYISSNTKLQYNDDVFLKMSNINDVNVDYQKIQYIEKMKKFETDIHEVLIRGVFAENNLKQRNNDSLNQNHHSMAHGHIFNDDNNLENETSEKEALYGHAGHNQKQPGKPNESDQSVKGIHAWHRNHGNSGHPENEKYTKNINDSVFENPDENLRDPINPVRFALTDGEEDHSPDEMAKRMKIVNLNIRFTVLDAPHEKKQSVFQYMLNSVPSNQLSRFLWSVHRKAKAHQQYRYALIGNMAMVNFFRYFFFIKTKKPCDIQIGLNRGMIYNISYSRCPTYFLPDDKQDGCMSQESCNKSFDENIIRRNTLRLSPNIVTYFGNTLSGRFLSIGHLFRNYLIDSKKMKDSLRLFTSTEISKVHGRLKRDPCDIIKENIDVSILALVDPGMSLWF